MTKDEEVEKEVFNTFLSEEEKEKIKKQALKELDEENKRKVAQEYKESIKAEAKRKALLKDAVPGTNEDGRIPVFIDLPRVSECIRLDGVSYYPDRTYHVLPEVAEVLYEIMGKSKEHEDEVSGRKDSNRMKSKTHLIAR